LVDQSTTRMGTVAQDRSDEVSRPKVLFLIEGRGEATAEFHRFASPRTADALLKRLPVQGRAAIYGEEVYFKVPVKAPAEKPRSTMEVGSIGYWPMGDAVCVFFGPTKPYSPVNVLGRVTGGLELFRSIKEGTLIEIRKA
jgi:uncharacterized protein